MQSQVEEIKKKLDIVEVIGKYLPLKKRGRHFIACCPFHGEKTPSFTVSPELQIFKCFGCGKAGDVFTFVQEFDNIDFKDALEDLAKIAGIVLIKNTQLTEDERRRKRLVDLNYEVAKFYNYILTSHPSGKEALDYLLSRAISSDTIKTFKIGYSPTNTSLISNYLTKKGFTPSEMIATGTFGNSNYGHSRMYDRFQGRIVFPLTDFRDRILGFSGRILPTSKNDNTAKYINSPETDLYHKSQMLFGLNLAKEDIKKNNSVIIVEGEFDMVSPYQLGVKNIVAIKGTAFTSEQLQLLHRYTDTLILGLDSDFAGNNAARKSIELADSMGFDIRVLSLGEDYKDPDEAIRADPEFFKNQLEHTLPVWDFIINSAVKSHDLDTIRGKKEVLSVVLPFLVKIDNSVTRSDYYNKLAAQIGSDPSAIAEEAEKLSKSFRVPEHQSTRAPEHQSTSVPKVDRLEEYLLTLIISSKKPDLLSQKVSAQFSFSTSRFQNIFLNLTKIEDEFDPKKFADTLSPELSPTFNNLYLSGTYLNIESQARLREIKKTISQVQSISLKDRISALSTKIAQAENSNDDILLKQLEVEYNQLLSELSKVQSTKA